MLVLTTKGIRKTHGRSYQTFSIQRSCQGLQVTSWKKKTIRNQSENNKQRGRRQSWETSVRERKVLSEKGHRSWWTRSMTCITCRPASSVALPNVILVFAIASLSNSALPSLRPYCLTSTYFLIFTWAGLARIDWKYLCLNFWQRERSVDAIVAIRAQQTQENHT